MQAAPIVTTHQPAEAVELRLSHLRQLEAESIHILREVASEFDNPVMLYSIGKDSAVMTHLARKAFYPGKLPFPLLHIDTTWKFKEMIAFRDKFTKEHGLDLLVHTNQQGVADNINPFEHGSNKYTQIMKTQALLQALANGGYDAAFGGARRDEEKSRAKERIYSFRDRYGQWDPKNQRPELWNLYNGKLTKGESIRAFPLSNCSTVSGVGAGGSHHHSPARPAAVADVTAPAAAIQPRRDIRGEAGTGAADAATEFPSTVFLSTVETRASAVWAAARAASSRLPNRAEPARRRKPERTGKSYACSRA